MRFKVQKLANGKYRVKKLGFFLFDWIKPVYVDLTAPNLAWGEDSIYYRSCVGSKELVERVVNNWVVVDE